jgi:hypothetical protein
MTAPQFAELLQARRTGRERWMGRCPAHDDSSASLSIGQGRDGRVLLNCFAACKLTSILAALGLQKRDLFANGPPPTPQQLATLQRQRNAEETCRKANRRVERDLEDRVRKLEAIRDALGSKLAVLPDADSRADEICRMFHDACDRHRKAHTQLEEIYEQAKRAASTALRKAS